MAMTREYVVRLDDGSTVLGEGAGGFDAARTAAYDRENRHAVAYAVPGLIGVWQRLKREEAS